MFLFNRFAHSAGPGRLDGGFEASRFRGHRGIIELEAPAAHSSNSKKKSSNSKQQDGPRRLQDGPQRAQDGPKMAPRWPQDGPKMAPRGSKMTPKGPQMAPREPKMAPTGPKTPPRQRSSPICGPLGPPKGPPEPLKLDTWDPQKVTTVLRDSALFSLLKLCRSKGRRWEGSRTDKKAYWAV